MQLRCRGRTCAARGFPAKWCSPYTLRAGHARPLHGGRKELGGLGKAHGSDESLPYGAKKLPALSAGSAGILTLAYTRVFKTSCSGTGASMGRGTPSTHWIAFFGHVLTQVPQPLHLV